MESLVLDLLKSGVTVFLYFDITVDILLNWVNLLSLIFIPVVIGDLSICFSNDIGDLMWDANLDCANDVFDEPD